jgi:hypothetical protein
MSKDKKDTRDTTTVTKTTSEEQVMIVDEQTGRHGRSSLQLYRATAAVIQDTQTLP